MIFRAQSALKMGNMKMYVLSKKRAVKLRKDVEFRKSCHSRGSLRHPTEDEGYVILNTVYDDVEAAELDMYGLGDEVGVADSGSDWSGERDSDEKDGLAHEDGNF